MLDPQRRKLVAVTPPAAIYDDASLTCAIIDTLGYDLCEIVLHLGATDIAMTALKVQESDASNMANATDITATVMGTAANDAGSTSTLPSATDDNKFFSFLIDLRGKKRYLQLVATCGNGSAGTYACAWAGLYRGEKMPQTAAEGGLSQRMVA